MACSTLPEVVQCAVCRVTPATVEHWGMLPRVLAVATIAAAVVAATVARLRCGAQNTFAMAYCRMYNGPN